MRLVYTRVLTWRNARLEPKVLSEQCELGLTPEKIL